MWWVVNDVTSLALAIAAISRVGDSGLRRITAVTVSSGIAARTIDVASGEVLLDRAHGVQGEIGHLGGASSETGFRGGSPMGSIHCAAQGCSLANNRYRPDAGTGDRS